MTEPALNLRSGDQLASAVSTTRVIVIRVPADRSPVIECGGSPMVAGVPGPKPAAADPDPTTLIGKRYTDASASVELLCTFSGAGALTSDGEPMTLKDAKPLPASD